MKQTQMMVLEGLRRLEEALRANLHLSSPDKVLKIMAVLGKYHKYLAEDDFKFLSNALIALEGQKAWHEPRKYLKPEEQKTLDSDVKS